MKLKYYLRGLGIGIILTTSIFMLSGYHKKLTNEEIKYLAKELGMVEASEKEDSLEQVLEEIKPTKEPEQEHIIDETAEQPLITPMPEPTEAPKPTDIPEEEKTITITIKEGMTSDIVSELLYETGLVDSAKKFNNYIIRVGKSKVIRTGDFTIHKGTSYDEIIKLITFNE